MLINESSETRKRREQRLFVSISVTDIAANFPSRQMLVRLSIKNSTDLFFFSERRRRWRVQVTVALDLEGRNARRQYLLTEQLSLSPKPPSHTHPASQTRGTDLFFWRCRRWRVQVMSAVDLEGRVQEDSSSLASKLSLTKTSYHTHTLLVRHAVLTFFFWRCRRWRVQVMSAVDLEGRVQEDSSSLASKLSLTKTSYHTHTLLVRHAVLTFFFWRCRRWRVQVMSAVDLEGRVQEDSSSLASKLSLTKTSYHTHTLLVRHAVLTFFSECRRRWRVQVVTAVDLERGENETNPR